MTDRMTTQELVKAHCKREGTRYEDLYVKLHQGIADGSIRIIRSGDTLLAYTIIAPHVADAALITADDQPGIVKALRGFNKGMRAAGFVRVEADIKSRSLIPMLRRAGIPFTVLADNRLAIEA
jgi:hypothetical protein